ncbi:alpha/beta hydrolase [Polyangium mundeleinium]|uniref:Alpha/beta fold hydrolase n=1 Tax=Polyangium mundeleinium TaxID=2995306 RepID=A0ABT5EYV4_9BACT|nr:alpha/beta fold hydrolase [Polyangium mundeleinium]MDC0746574.1 alpha/beta fold hydrolase [Polyangium mundeleinium]
MPAPQLPIGFQHFHPNDFVNYQLNRAHALGTLPRATAERGAAQIERPEDVPAVFGALAGEAEREGRWTEAAGCARLAEFFTPRPSDVQVAAYERYRGLWDRAVADEGITRHEVPFEGAFLPALTRPAVGARRGTVLVFGGFDSVIEEFFPIWRSVSQAGFDAVAFDGPGQGGARARHGVPHTHDWERPVAAVLDHFRVERAALVGMSMGGYWAIRAASREPRIAAVVSWSPVYDWLGTLPRFAAWLVRRMVGWTRFMNVTIRWRMRMFPILRHVVAQANWMTRAEEPVAAARWFLGMNREHLGSERVSVPTLLFVGERDRFQPPALAALQARALTAAPVTTRIFTAAENADQHCQMGNLPLATAELCGWLGRTLPP